MSRIKIRKYQLITILESIRDDMKLNTIDEVINDINKCIKDDNDIAIQYDDIDLSKVKEANDYEYEIVYVKK